MSLDIRYLTNGTKNVYVVVDTSLRPVPVNYYDTRDEIPVQIRHYAPEGKPMFVGPNGARNLFAMKALYPDLMNERCSLPEFVGLPCIFESCQLCWQACNGRYTETGI